MPLLARRAAGAVAALRVLGGSSVRASGAVVFAYHDIDDDPEPGRRRLDLARSSAATTDRYPHFPTLAPRSSALVALGDKFFAERLRPAFENVGDIRNRK
jgi:hypothetical protein